MILSTNPRDNNQINVLARQMYPGNTKYFMGCFKNTTEKPYGLLIIKPKHQTHIVSEQICFQSIRLFMSRKKVENANMSARIHRNMPLLKIILKAKQVQRRLILQSASNELILTLCEVAFNILCGTILLTNSQYKKLEKKKTDINFIADKKIGVRRKKQAINQRGDSRY